MAQLAISQAHSVILFQAVLLSCFANMIPEQRFSSGYAEETRTPTPIVAWDRNSRDRFHFHGLDGPLILSSSMNLVYEPARL